MATTFAAMRARLGDTEYYVLSMKAQDLVNRIGAFEERDGVARLRTAGASASSTPAPCSPRCSAPWNRSCPKPSPCRRLPDGGAGITHPLPPGRGQAAGGIRTMLREDRASLEAAQRSGSNQQLAAALLMAGQSAAAAG